MPMITKFSVLYVGQIELDHVGRDGTPADERRYSNERLVEAFQTAKDVASVRLRVIFALRQVL